MNREHVLFHLREASDELAKTIRDLEVNPTYDFGELMVAVTHAYHHLNTAWNGRDATDEAQNPTDEQFAAWSEFPRDLLMMK